MRMDHNFSYYKVPYVTEKLKGIGGKIRTRPDLFIVEEIPAYEPLGYGDHVYVNLTKSMKTTRETQIELAKIFGLRRENVGHAGLKDKYAVTTQTFSILIMEIDIKEVICIIESNLGVKVNWVKRHPRKLRSGHLKGNRFNIVVTDLNTSIVNAKQQAEKIRLAIDQWGIPNYFGIQRFGNDGKNTRDGYGLITGEHREPNRWLRRYLISSYLSLLCNKYLSERVRIGFFSKLMKGDIAKKHDTGGVFLVEDPEIEKMRFEAKQISFTAPIFGYKMREPEYEAKRFEEKIFLDSGITLDQLKKAGAEGTRRLGRLTPDLEIKLHKEGLNILFNLPSGAFATTILREIMKADENTKEPEFHDQGDLDHSENCSN